MDNENVARLIERIAPQIGAITFMEPVYRKFGMVIFQNGKRLFFKNNQININTSSTVAVTINKCETSNFLSYLGYNVPIGKTFSNHPYDIQNGRGIKDGLAFAQKLGFPVILKPNDKAQGVLVCKVNNEAEFYEVSRKITKKKDAPLLVEKFYDGYADYRIVVLGDRVISAYQRIPLTVTGNGKQNILELLQEKQKYFDEIGRPIKEVDLSDFRIIAHLKNEGKGLDYIPSEAEQVTLLDNANLSSGGTTLELTDEVAEEYCDLAISIAHDMNLNLCGIDILAPTIKKWCENYIILEINSAPGLDNYAFTGDKQKGYVDSLYLQILKYVEDSFTS